MRGTLTYAIVTPSRDEATNLERLAGALAAQTALPTEWIIVDNGSIDDTSDVIDALARRHSWIRGLAVPGEARAVPGAPIVRAFHAGVGALGRPVDVVVKVDADVSMEPRYFERLLSAIQSDPRLGISSGVCLEQSGDRWVEARVTGTHARGASRAYRWSCLQDVMPLEEGIGWDTIDELKAGMLGWRTRIVEDALFYHHRTLGGRDGQPWTRSITQGRAARYIGYRFWYLALRALHRARRNPVALAMVLGYIGATMRREPRYHDAAVRAYLREQQKVSKLPLRVREVLGRRTG